MSGRRFGKTALGISEVCENALNGERWAWFAPSYKYTQEVWRELLSILGDAIQNKNASEHRIELHGEDGIGGTIEIWTLAGASPEDVARGRKYHGVVIDEAGLVDNLKAIFEQAIYPTLTDFGGTALFLGTPKERRQDFVQMHIKGLQQQGVNEDGDTEGTWNAFNGETVENTFIPNIEKKVARAKRDLPEHIFNQEYRGIPSDDGLNPFGLKFIADAIAEPSDEPTVCWGVDLARKHDWTVVVGLDEWGRWTHYERWQKQDWNVTKLRIMQICQGAPALVDESGVGDPVLQDLQAAGMDAYPFLFHDTSKRQLCQRLIVALAGHRTTIPTGVVENEFKSFEATVRKNGRISYSAPEGQHDDTVMAWGLAYTLYERLGTIEMFKTDAPMDYIKANIDPDVYPDLVKKLKLRDERDGQYEDRGNEQFSESYFW